MLRRVGRFVMRLLPAVFVAAAWFSWWILPERPLRVCILDVKRNSLPLSRPPNWEWAIIYPDTPGDHESFNCVLIFDPNIGRTDKLPTPRRVDARMSSDCSRLAWSDADGRIHVVTLPDNRPVLTTPPRPEARSLSFQISPQNRWLLITEPFNAITDVWDLTTGAKCSSIKSDGGELIGGYYFGGANRVWLVRQDPAKRIFSLSSAELPSGSTKFIGNVPWPPSEPCGFAFEEEKPLFSIADTLGANETVWDISVSPPLFVPGEVLPPYTPLSPDGRYRMVTPRHRDDNWTLENAKTGQVISRSADHNRSACSGTCPWDEVFTGDNRFVMLQRYGSEWDLPNWVPKGLEAWWEALGFGKRPNSLVLCDAASGREVREFTDATTVLIAPNSDRIWLKRDPPPGSPHVLEEYPVGAPRPPWWLWALTAVGIGWYAFRSWRMRT